MTSGPSVRLIGGPRILDGRIWARPAAPDGTGMPAGDRLLIAVHEGHSCPLDDLRRHCVDRQAAEQLAAIWRVVVYAPFGRPRRIRMDLYRYERIAALEAGRDRHGGWTVQPGLPSVADLGRPAGQRSLGPLTGAEPTTWTQLQDGVDRAAARFRQVAALLPDGPLADRAAGATAAVDASVTDAARLCEVGASIAPDWLPGDAGDEAASLVTRVTVLVGTIDEATRELVQVHLELAEPPLPAESLALLAAAVAELAAPPGPPEEPA
jgi:hypothetical protein